MSAFRWTAPTPAPDLDPEPASPPAPKRYRLLARAQMHGALREPGYEFVLAEGEIGPHKGVHLAHDLVDNDPSNGIDANRIIGKAMDVPLYEEIPE